MYEPRCQDWYQNAMNYPGISMIKIIKLQKIFSKELVLSDLILMRLILIKLIIPFVELFRATMICFLFLALI